MRVFRYWRETLDGLVGLACDAFETPIVLAGEWMLARMERRQDIADFDRAMAEDDGQRIKLADYLAEVEAEQEVWEPRDQKRPLAAVIESMVIATEILADAVEMLEQHLPTTEGLK